MRALLIVIAVASPLSASAQARVIDGDTIMLQPYPEFDAAKVNADAMADLEWVKQFIVAIRNIRAEMDIAPSKLLEVLLVNVSETDQRRLEENLSFLTNMAKLESITVASGELPPTVTQLVGAMEVRIPMAGLIDKDAELARLAKQLEKVEQERGRVAGKLGNEGFVAKAPEAVIAKEREKLAELEETQAKLKAQYASIEAL